MQSSMLIDLAGVVPAVAPSPAVCEALLQPPEDGTQCGAELRQRLALEYRLNERNVVLIADLDSVAGRIAEQTTGPLVLFPPATTDLSIAQLSTSRAILRLGRGFGRDGMITLDAACDLPHDGVAMISSPADPLANLLTANDAVRLARSCRWLIIDERYADYAGQSLLGLASEFPNVIVLRSFQARLGASAVRAGWATGSTRAQDVLTAIAAELPPAIGHAALTALGDTASGRTLLSFVRDERSRLFRSLRKLSYLQPLPSWGPFVTARVEVGERDTLVTLLAARGIRIHAPRDPGLERYLRIGIGLRRDMESLRCTLLDIAPIMLNAQLPSGGSDAYRLTLSGEELSQPQVRQVQERRQRSA